MACKQAVRCYLSLLLVLVFTAPCISAWGSEGHQIVAEIAQSRLSPQAAEHVRQLLPEWAEGLMGRVASWADFIRGEDPKDYGWTTELHYINTPDDKCSYNFTRDCKDRHGDAGFCVAGAVANYTHQLAAGAQAMRATAARNAAHTALRGEGAAASGGLQLHKPSEAPRLLVAHGGAADASSGYNLTEALMFLIHFMGDLHQPLHCGHEGDEGGELIHVHFNGRACLLHQVWDGLIIREAIADDFQGYLEDLEEHIRRGINVSGLEEFEDHIKKNINEKWQAEVVQWLSCENSPPSSPPPGSLDQPLSLLDGTCADKYAEESIEDACMWAYRDVSEHCSLGEEYYATRLPVVIRRLAQAGVRLAAVLNKIFQTDALEAM